MLYHHYKGGVYRVLFVASESTNARVKPGKPVDLVVYVSLSTGKIHVRDYEEFHGFVDRSDQNQNACRRFVETLISPNDI